MFNFVFLFLKRLFQFNSSTVSTHLASVVTLNNEKCLQKLKVTFSDKVLAVADLLFAKALYCLIKQFLNGQLVERHNLTISVFLYSANRVKHCR